MTELTPCLAVRRPGPAFTGDRLAVPREMPRLKTQFDLSALVIEAPTQFRLLYGLARAFRAGDFRFTGVAVLLRFGAPDAKGAAVPACFIVIGSVALEVSGAGGQGRRPLLCRHRAGTQQSHQPGSRHGVKTCSEHDEPLLRFHTLRLWVSELIAIEYRGKVEVFHRATALPGHSVMPVTVFVGVICVSPRRRG